MIGRLFIFLDRQHIGPFFVVFDQLHDPVDGLLHFRQTYQITQLGQGLFQRNFDFSVGMGGIHMKVVGMRGPSCQPARLHGRDQLADFFGAVRKRPRPFQFLVDTAAFVETAVDIVGINAVVFDGIVIAVFLGFFDGCQNRIKLLFLLQVDFRFQAQCRERFRRMLEYLIDEFQRPREVVLFEGHFRQHKCRFPIGGVAGEGGLRIALRCLVIAVLRIQLRQQRQIGIAGAIQFHRPQCVVHRFFEIAVLVVAEPQQVIHMWMIWMRPDGFHQDRDAAQGHVFPDVVFNSF